MPRKATPKGEAKGKTASMAVVPFVGPRVGPDEETRRKAFEARLALEERWHSAWRMRQAGHSYRAIAREIGVDVHTAHDYVKAHQAKWGCSPLWEVERERQLAVLEELEKRLWAEAEDGIVTWAAAAGPIARVLLDQREVMGADKAPPAALTGTEAGPGFQRAMAVVRELRGDRQTTR